MAKRNNQKAARAIAEWALYGFKYGEAQKVADNHSVTVRTLTNWYIATKKDPELSELYQKAAKTLADQDWAQTLSHDISQLQSLLLSQAKESKSVQDLTLAHRSLAELQIAKELLSE